MNGRALKIGMVIFRGDPRRGGAERYTADVAAALAWRGHAVDLISTQFGPDIPGVRFEKIDAGGPTRAGQYLNFLSALDSRLRDAKYDLVHSMLPVRHCDIYHPHAGMAKAGLETHLTRMSPAARALAQLANSLNRKRRLYAQVEEQMIRDSKKPIVICLSDYVKGMILRHYPDIPGQLVKLFNGTDLKKFDPAAHAPARQASRKKLGIAPDATVALMIAQHFERKGLAELTAATAKLADESRESAPTVVVVGKDDASHGRQRARQLRVEDKIIFAGQTSDAADFYAAADFFVLPTRHDSCSLVVLESLAMGLPVISTAFNGACEIMTDGVHGFVLPDPGDVAALAAAMSRLLDAQTRQRMSEACLALRPALSFESHMDRLEEIYRARIASGRHV
jgi:UDP-glucose:(heptosyl)LPS alpha-1,3-glucosyltransferase